MSLRSPDFPLAQWFSKCGAGPTSGDCSFLSLRLNYTFIVSSSTLSYLMLWICTWCLVKKKLKRHSSRYLLGRQGQGGLENLKTPTCSKWERPEHFKKPLLMFPKRSKLSKL